MSRELIEILESGEIASIQLNDTETGSAVLTSDEIITQNETQLADGSITAINIGGTDTGNAVVTSDDVVAQNSDNGVLLFGGIYDGTQESFTKNSVWRDGEWLMICTADTEDRPGPTVTGSVQDLYPDDTGLVETSLSATYLLMGIRSTAEVVNMATGYSVYTVAGYEYSVYYVEDPDNNDTMQHIATFTATATGWHAYRMAPILVNAGSTVDSILKVSLPATDPTVYTANYNYALYNSDTVPANGYIAHGRTTDGYLNISYIDADSNDQTETGGVLDTLQVGATIKIAGMEWTVLGFTDQTTYYRVEVSPAVRLTTAELYEVEFEEPEVSTIVYHTEADYYASNANVSGLFIQDGSYQDIVETDNQYSLDLMWKPVYVSDNWKVMSYSGGTVLMAGSPYDTVSMAAEHHHTLDQLLSVTYTTTDNLGPSLDLAEIQAIVPADHPSRFLIKDPSNTWIVIWDGTNYFSTQMAIAT